MFLLSGLFPCKCIQKKAGTSTPHSVLLGPAVVALQLYIERLAKAVRKKRADAEKTAAEAQLAAAASSHLPASGVLLS